MLSYSRFYGDTEAMLPAVTQEEFSQTASATHAWGASVAAFNVGDLLDIVRHRRTGYLVEPLNTKELAHGIAWVIVQRESGRLGQRAREKAVAQFSEYVVSV